MELPSNYIIDSENIQLKAYRLLSLFYANKEIAQKADPEDENDPIHRLEKKYFYSETSKLLLELAISLRVLDDQMAKLPDGEIKENYINKKNEVNRRNHCMMFDEMPLREVCNKIIHADVVEPHFREANASHEIDDYNWMGYDEAREMAPDEDIPEPVPIKWQHLTYNIRLGGKHRGDQWWHLLMVPVFVQVISELLE